MSDQSHHSGGTKIYYQVFGALLFLTIVTVLVGFMHVNIVLGVAVALVIATIKSSLVVSFFMHLISEKKLIYQAMITTMLLFVTMVILFIVSYYDLPQGSHHIKVEPTQTSAPEHHAAEAEAGHHGS